MTLDIVEALIYLRSQNIIHRDIKLGNLFLDDKFVLKIGDFGLATRCVPGSNELKKTLCGTPNYIAPEIISKQGYSYEVDVWSLGIALYTMLVGKPPFYSELKNPSELCQMILNEPVKFPSNLSPSCRNILFSLLQKNPGKLYCPSIYFYLYVPFLSKYLYKLIF